LRCRRDRYFIVDGYSKYIKYYKGIPKPGYYKKPRGIFNMQQRCHVKVFFDDGEDNPDSQPYCMAITSTLTGLSLIMSFGKEDEMREWQGVLEKNVEFFSHGTATESLKDLTASKVVHSDDSDDSEGEGEAAESKPQEQHQGFTMHAHSDEESGDDYYDDQEYNTEDEWLHSDDGEEDEEEEEENETDEDSDAEPPGPVVIGSSRRVQAAIADGVDAAAAADGLDAAAQQTKDEVLSEMSMGDCAGSPMAVSQPPRERGRKNSSETLTAGARVEVAHTPSSRERERARKASSETLVPAADVGGVFAGVACSPATPSRKVSIESINVIVRDHAGSIDTAGDAWIDGDTAMVTTSGEHLVGRSIKVDWEEDGGWMEGVVLSYSGDLGGDGEYEIKYLETGQLEREELCSCRWKLKRQNAMNTKARERGRKNSSEKLVA
jgi:hypothetical protein